MEELFVSEDIDLSSINKKLEENEENEENGLDFMSNPEDFIDFY